MASIVFRPVFVFVVSLAIILGAYGFQYIGGLPPCQLCFWQRYPYFVIVPLALIAMLVPASGRVLLALCGLAYLVGAGIAGYHTGVEYLWWPGPDACSPVGGSIEDLLSREVVVRCDEVPWSLFGISMAGYNFLLSAVMAVICFEGARRKNT